MTLLTNRRIRKGKRFRRVASQPIDSALDNEQDNMTATTAPNVQFSLPPPPKRGKYGTFRSALLDDLSVASVTSVFSQLSQGLQELKRLKQADNMSVLSSTQRTICKQARLYSHHTAPPGEIDLCFFSSSPAKAIYACIGLTILFQQTVFLYGILAVLWLQIAWVALRWMLYLLDDPELKTAWVYMKGWAGVAKRHGDKIVNDKSSRSLRLLAACARQVPRGMGIARVFIRDLSAKANQQVLDDLRRHIDSGKKFRGQVAE